MRVAAAARPTAASNEVPLISSNLGERSPPLDRGPEQEGKQHQHHSRSGGGNDPDTAPIVPAVRKPVGINHASRDKGADEVADAISHKVEEPLRRRANLLTSLLVGIDLPAHEEEVVADAVQQDACIDQ